MRKNNHTQNDLAGVLRMLGLAEGDSLIVHSSFRSLQPFEADPEAVVDVILQLIGPSGNLMLPTFNYTSSLPEPYFDPDQTPCRTGIIPELGRQREDAIRSLHPTHSVAVIGPEAVRLCERHLEGRAFGIDSPIDRLAEMGGKILLIGVGHEANSAIHVAEERAGLPKVNHKDPMPILKIKAPSGTIIQHQLDSSPSCSSDFGAVEEPLRNNDFIADGRIGGCLLQLISAKAAIDQAVAMIREDPTALLCGRAECRLCPGVRRNLGV